MAFRLVDQDNNLISFSSPNQISNLVMHEKAQKNIMLLCFLVFLTTEQQCDPSPIKVL